LRQATKTQQLICEMNPDAPAAVSIRKIVQKLRGYEGGIDSKGSLQFFWEQIIGVA